jgi:hypothetical protein
MPVKTIVGLTSEAELSKMIDSLSA